MAPPVPGVCNDVIMGFTGVDAAGQKYMAEKGMVRTIVPENLINKTSVQPGGIKLAARKDIPAKSEAAKWNFTSEEMRLFAQLVHAEANGEPYSGKVAVAAAILNRIECEEYPDDLNSVIFQVESGYYQFHPLRTAVSGRNRISPHTGR